MGAARSRSDARIVNPAIVRVMNIRDLILAASDAGRYSAKERCRAPTADARVSASAKAVGWTHRRGGGHGGGTPRGVGGAGDGGAADAHTEKGEGWTPQPSTRLPPRAGAAVMV